jgi:hypothetical protein
MAITQVGSATSNSSAGGSNIAVTKPTGVASGDVLIAFGATTETTPYFDTVPSGWTQFESSATGDTPGLFRASAWYKVAGGSEPSSYTWGSSGASGAGAPLVVLIAAFRGVDNTTPIDASSEVAGGTSSEPSNSAAAITQTDTGRQFFMRASREDSSTIPQYSTAASGWSFNAQDGAFSGGSVSYGIGFFLADSDSGAGARNDPAVSCTASETDNVYILGALKAEATPATGTFDATLGNVTQAGAGEVHDDATIAMQLGGVGVDFNVTHFPPASGDITFQLSNVTEAFAGNTTGGSFAMQLSPVVADFAGQTINASFAMQLSQVTEAFSGSVNPIGSFSAQLNSIQLIMGVETIPFGEQVIRVEAEARAFLVTDEDTGLIKIERSQVTDA